MLSAALIVGVCLLGCSGRGGSSSSIVPAPTTAAAKHAKVPLKVRVVIPAAPSTFAGKRRPMFVASTTEGIDVKVYASSDSGHTNPLSDSQTDVSSGSAACGGTYGFPRTCTISIAAPAGEDDFVVASYDSPPSGGSFSGLQIAAALVPDQTINPSVDNSISITLGGVVASTYLALSVPYVACPGSTTQQMAVVGLDADGNVIASDGYVDSSGNPVSINLSANPYEYYGQYVSISPTSVSAPSATGVAVNYTATEGYAATITASPSNTGTPFNTTLTFVCPTVAEYAVTTSNSEPYGIAAGPDGAMWFTEITGNKIGRVTTAGVVTNEYTIPTSGSEPNGITQGPDGRLWFTEFAQFGTAKIGAVTTSGTFSEYSSGLTSTAYPLAITEGSDGNLWFTEKNASYVGRITPSGVITQFAVSSPGTGSITSDGTNLWFTEIGANVIGEMNTSGTLLHEYSLAGISGSTNPNSIVLGSDGNLWFSEYGIGGYSSIDKITTGGLIGFVVSTGYTTPGYITAGSDGAIWFTTGSQVLGRVTTAGALTYYPIPSGYNSSPPYSGSSVIAPGPDSAIWFAETTTNNIGHLPL